MTRDAVFLFGVRPDRDEPEIADVPLGRDDVRDLVATARAPLTGDHGALGAALADRRLVGLLAPVADWAEPGELVYLVPHDALHLLPLHAVPVGGVPLAERHPVAYSPSASVLRYCRAKSTGRRSSALVMADPGHGGPLVFVREQALAVAGHFGDAEVLSGRSVKRSRMSKLGSYDVLHIAAHGVFDAEDPMNSGIELADGRFTAQDFLNLSLDVDLVTLGACETGLSGRQPGDELVGLTRALLYAGAPSVLVTLWRVDELSTSMLLTRFYAQLTEGCPKVHALQRAQSWLRERTIGDVLSFAREARGRRGLDDVSVGAVDLEVAALHMAGRDFAAAEELYETIRARPGLTAEQAGAARVGSLQARLMRDQPAASDLDRRVFDDPYHWAPFVLVGDWW
ncbi:CHAT domain-containing protein [Nonomuraea candida]|uniref:CHAT domain-containing protein n=1 Tax=Nonomuraea candida TaxID=359159 RepID=UPI0014704C54|nr:CHAT domain-containing protein [Nonomuraea candida]